MKTCTRCHRHLPADANNFALDPRNRSGLAADCRDCRHTTVRENKRRLRLAGRVPCPECGCGMSARLKLCSNCKARATPETRCQANGCHLPRKHHDARGCGLHWPIFDRADMPRLEEYAQARQAITWP